MKWQDKAIYLFGTKWKASLAEIAGVSKRTIQRWNCGEQNPNPMVLMKLDETYETWRVNK